jgi:hypothetical protein
MGWYDVSMPLIPSPDSEDLSPPPLGFVLASSVLVTIRFSDMQGLDQAAQLFKARIRPTPASKCL